MTWGVEWWGTGWLADIEEEEMEATEKQKTAEEKERRRLEGVLWGWRRVLGDRRGRGSREMHSLGGGGVRRFWGDCRFVHLEVFLIPWIQCWSSIFWLCGGWWVLRGGVVRWGLRDLFHVCALYSASSHYWSDSTASNRGVLCGWCHWVV